MKKFQIFNAIILIIPTLAIQSCFHSNEKHLGEWKGESKGQVGSLILDKTKHAVFVMGNQVIGGDNFVIQGGKQGECKYEIDYSKNPIWLDIVIYEKGKTEESGRLKGIIRFVTDNKMEFRLNFDGQRFDNFDLEDKENTIVLDKVTN